MNKQPFTRMAPLVNTLADRMDRECDIPYVLYGHSMGALIAFELARELAVRRIPGPRHLFVSGRRAPQCPGDEQHIFNLPDQEFLKELKRLNGTPEEVFDSPELMKLFIGVLRADFEIVETYEYRVGEPLAYPISVYGGLEDEYVSLESCQAWQQETRANCTVRMLPGNHFFIRGPNPEFMSNLGADLVNVLRSSRS